MSGDRYPWYVFRGHPSEKMPPDDKLDGNPGWFVNPHDTPIPPLLYRAFEALAAFDYHKKKPKRGEEPEVPDRWADRFAPPAEDGVLPEPRARLWPFVNSQWALGGPGSGAPQHFHNTAWNGLVYGLKRWLIYPPAYNLMSNMQIRMWDETDRWDNQDHGQPRALECIQRAGEIAFIPELWGHGVINLAETVAIATEAKFSLYRTPLPKALRLVKNHGGHRSYGDEPRHRPEYHDHDRPPPPGRRRGPGRPRRPPPPPRGH